MMLKNLKNSLRRRVLENKGLMGIITFAFLLKGWDLMMAKASLFYFSLGFAMFGLGFFSIMPIIVRLITGKEYKRA